MQWPILMEQRDLVGTFNHHFASHLTGKIKPDEEAFEHVLTTLGCKGPEMLFLDDRQLNVAPAERVGMTACRYRDLKRPNALRVRPKCYRHSEPVNHGL